MGLFLLFWAVIATIAGFMAGGILACLIDDAFNNKMKVSAIIALTLVIMIAMYAIVNMTIYQLMPSNKERVASFTEAAALHEFSSGSEYPLEIGARSVSATGETSVSGGIFSISAYAKMQAGASILVDYQHGDGTHEVLEIPLSVIRFNIIGDGEMSSMVINLTNLPGADGYVAKDTLGDCHPSIQWGWWLRDCATIKNTQVTSTIGDEGLAGLFQKALSSNPGKFVTISVTRDEYNQILGSAGSATETETETPTPSPAQR